MEDIVNQYKKYGDSLNSFCLEKNIPYMKIYKYIKKKYPDLLSVKNNGKTKKSKLAQEKSIKFNVTKEELEKLFFVDGMGQKQIAEYYKVSKTSVCKKMKQYEIDVRSVGQSRYWDDNRREHFRMLANTGVVGVFRHQNWKYHSTSIENFFIDECKRLGISYKRQFPIEKYGHQYDFYVPKYNLFVEMDGEYFHKLPKQMEKDKKQMERSKKLGYNIVRITDKQIKQNKNIITEILNGFN